MKLNQSFPKELVLIPVKNSVVFPQSILSIHIEKQSKHLIDQAVQSNKFIFTSALESYKENSSNVYKVGCVSLIMRTKDLPDGSVKILIQGLCRGTIQEFNKDFTQVTVDCYEEKLDKVSKEHAKKADQLKSLFKDLSHFKEHLTPEVLLILSSIEHPGQVCDRILDHLELQTVEMQKVLEAFTLDQRLEITQKILTNELEVAKIQGRIKNMIQKELPKTNSQNYQDANKFQNTGQSSKKEEIQNLFTQIKEKNLPEDIEKETLKQLERLEKMHPESSESSIVRNYLDWIVELPWNHSSQDNLDLENAKEILDQDHFEMKKAKERILEFLAVRSLKAKDLKGPILCFSGPPGVGKTSLGKSIATAMGRTYHRVSLGGIKDESEIRGHRKTYVGSMPGKIIQALKACGTNNPVIVLDEVDKLGSDFRGDPSSALLEVLDPEQNHSFKDHYLNLNFDLSQVLFIATANVIHNIPAALKDRLEIISISGYTLAEKVEIAKKYLIKKEVERNGLPENHVKFTEESLSFLIRFYTQEAGLRNLNREISSICRKIAKSFVLGAKKPEIVDVKSVEKWLGTPYFFPENHLKEDKVGIATGLAWTEVGGQTLHVESIKIKNKKGGLILTGKLGDVMKESAQAALSFVKSYTESLISPAWFDAHEIHVHLPGGAIPKDGPSAGITLACSLISLITNTPVKKDIAMTGEITLSGRVLPVGGIKEKILAAFNQGIRTVIIPKQNEKDLKDVKKAQRDQMKFVLVSQLDEVFETALSLPPKSQKMSIKDILGNKNLNSAA